MKEPLVSVIIPIYNREHTLNRCLDSALSQTYKNLEILCVNDASTDGTAKLLDDYQKRDSRIKVFTHEVNKNAGGARNTAIKNAKGEYLYLLDSDDWVDPTAIEGLVKIALQDNYDIVSVPLTIHESGVEPYVENHIKSNATNEEILSFIFMHGIRIVGSLFKRSLYSNIAYPENMFYEDNAVDSLPFLYAKSICFVEDSGYHVDMSNTGSSSRVVDKKHIYDRIHSTDLMVENLRERGFYEKYKTLIDYRWLYLTRYTIILIGELPYNEAKIEARKVYNKVHSILPNKYFDNFDTRQQEIFLDPVSFIVKLKKERNGIYQFIHKVRHMIVICVKKMLGMNPQKSIYSKK